MCGQILETINGDRDSGLSCANYCGFKTIIAVPTSIIQEPKKVLGMIGRTVSCRSRDVMQHAPVVQIASSTIP